LSRYLFFLLRNNVILPNAGVCLAINEVLNILIKPALAYVQCDQLSRHMLCGWQIYLHPTAGQHLRQLKDDQQYKRIEIPGVWLMCMDLGAI